MWIAHVVLMLNIVLTSFFVLYIYIPSRVSLGRVLLLIGRVCACQVSGVCAMALFSSAFFHHRYSVEFARIKFALAAWVCLNHVVDGTHRVFFPLSGAVVN